MTKEQVNAVYNAVLNQCADAIVKAIENAEKDGNADYIDENCLSEFVATHVAEKVWYIIHK